MGLQWILDLDDELNCLVEVDDCIDFFLWCCALLNATLVSNLYV